MRNSENKSQNKLPLYFSIGVVVILIALYFFVPDVQEFFKEAWEVLTSDDEKRIKEWVEGFGWLGPIVLIFAMIAQLFLLVIPSVLLMIVTILAYGPIWGSLIILVAIFSASTVGFIIGKYLGETFVLQLLGKETEEKIESFIEKYGFWAVVVTRLNPFLSNDAISFVAGMLTMKYWKFIGATLIGIAPLTAFIAYLGKSTDSLKTGLLWGSVVSLILFGGYIYWDKKINKD